MLSIPIGTVMSRISRGRHMLFERLKSSASRRRRQRRSRSTTGRLKSTTELMPCDRSTRSSTPFVDGELPEPDRRAVEDHLRACPPCHSRVVAERAVHDADPRAARRRCSERRRRPTRCTRRCWATARRAARRRPARAAAPAAPPPVAGWRRASRRTRSPRRSCSSSAARSSIRRPTSRRSVLAAELTADHVKCFAMNSALGTHQEPAAVESSMAVELRLAHAPAGRSGARRARAGRRAAVPLRRRRDRAHHVPPHGHPVSLFMLPKTARTRGARRGARARGGDLVRRQPHVRAASRASRAPRSSGWRRSFRRRCIESGLRGLQELEERAA